MTATDGPLFITLEEACRRIGMSYRHGTRLAREGRFPVRCTRIANRWRVSVYLLDQFARTGIPDPDPGVPPVDPAGERDEWATVARNPQPQDAA